ncbi:hypothetical protein IAU60_000555 [Kwoniella sp. DSM 27419]
MTTLTESIQAVITLPSPLESPRSSCSSTHPSGLPITPVDELDKMASEMVLSSSEDEEGVVDAGVDMASGVAGTKDQQRRADLPSLRVPPPTFGHFAFPMATSPASASSLSSDSSPNEGPLGHDDIALPKAGFTFGTCPSTRAPFLGTPATEQGPFEYPELGHGGYPPGSPLHNRRRESLALGLAHRRGSIIAPHSNTLSAASPSIPSPPSTRRSSTCSTIVTLPAAGRRPSILHSATVESAIPQFDTSAITSGSEEEESEVTPLASAGPSRRASNAALVFPPRHMAAPIPPSLLARRGSLPAAQLFGLPLTEQPGRVRASYSSGSHFTTTAALYNRRASVVTSESGFSTGSSGTVMGGDRDVRRGSVRQGNPPLSPPLDDDEPLTQPPAYTGRRGSVSFFPPPPMPSVLRSSTSSSRSSIVSNSSSTRSSFTSSSPRSSVSSSRMPINFSSRMPHPVQTQGHKPRQGSSSGTMSSPSSPRMGYSASVTPAAVVRRNKHAQSASGESHAGSGSGPGSFSSLSSSEESNEEGDSEGSPRASRGSGPAPAVPVFSNPWSESPTGSTGSGAEGKALAPPLETPPLETVVERPPLETFDSGATEKP